ncbi:MAG: 2-dehydropantoate 2-reductase [FCB group bacterium]|nr:2-dehydropantoate 2-reductase [FCB group bacterium]
MKQPRICVIGAGPVGSVLAVHLINAGHAVHVVDVRPDYIKAIRESGLQIVGASDNYARVEYGHTAIHELKKLTFDQIFLCVKSIDLAGTARELQSLKLEGATYVLFENGIDNEEILAGFLPRENILRGVINYAGMVTRPGVVTMTFFNPPNFVGHLVPEAREKAKNVSALLTEAGLRTKYTKVIRKKAWRKTILNAVIMPISVITGLTMGNIITHPELREIILTLLEEFREVAKMEGYVFKDHFAAKAIHYFVRAGDHKTSMSLDFEAGRPLELASMNLKIQEYADRHGVPCEYNRILCTIMKGLLIHRDGLNGASDAG